MKRLTPECDHDSVGRPIRYMRESDIGEYVSIFEVYDWLKSQRNDIPMTGKEAADGFLEVLDNKITKTKERK